MQIIFTEKQRKAFEEACAPLIEWRKENLCPHDVIVIDASFAEVLSGSFGFPFAAHEGKVGEGKNNE